MHVLDNTKLDIILSLSTRHSLSDVTALLKGSSVSMFHRLVVEEGCWRLPVLKNGESCFGAAAFRSSEFTRVLGEIVTGIIEDATARRPVAV
jgi:hypothetical protein